MVNIIKKDKKSKTREQIKKEYTYEQLADIYESSLSLKDVSEVIGMRYTTFKTWVDSDPELKSLFETVVSIATEEAKKQHYIAILNGDKANIILELKAKGGYGEDDKKDEKPAVFNLNLGTLDSIKGGEKIDEDVMRNCNLAYDLKPGDLANIKVNSGNKDDTK